jgi:hypothetical protein
MNTLNNNSTTRAFAESFGKAIAFGESIVSCDCLLNTMSGGYFYYANDSDATIVSPTDPVSSYHYWHDYLQQAKNLAAERNEDPDTYGVRMKFAHGRGAIYITLVRCEWMRSKMLDIAENDSIQCPSHIISFGRNEQSLRISLSEEGRETYPQQDDPAGRAEVEAGKKREQDDLSDWLSVNVNFEK